MAITKVVVLGDLSAKWQKQIAGVKRRVVGMADKFQQFRQALDRDKLAVTLIDMFNGIKADRGADNPFTLADFARCFDETVPSRAADTDEGIGYRNHHMYQALDYMQRKLRRPRGEGTANRTVATDIAARALATVLQRMDKPQAEQFWIAVRQEFGLTVRRFNTLQRKVADAKPIVEINASRFSVGKLIHMDRPVAPAAAATAEAAEVAEAPARGLAARGQRIRKTA